LHLAHPLLLSQVLCVWEALSHAYPYPSNTRVVQGYYFIAHKRGKKILKIDDYIAATISGGVADAQAIVASLQWEARTYKLERGVNMPVKAAANIASIILSSTRMAPLYIQLVIGGYDKEGTSLYILDPLGGFRRIRLRLPGCNGIP
jgi:proteasome beta subunit